MLRMPAKASAVALFCGSSAPWPTCVHMPSESRKSEALTAWTFSAARISDAAISRIKTKRYLQAFMLDGYLSVRRAFELSCGAQRQIKSGHEVSGPSARPDRLLCARLLLRKSMHLRGLQGAYGKCESQLLDR